MARPPARPRGSSLIELMIAMAVIAVGLLAMWHLHVVGLTSTAAGRRHTVATALARELVSGLERLQFTDELLSKNYVGPGTPADFPSNEVFGSLVDPSGAIKSGPLPPHVWDDKKPVPGVRLDTEMREKAEGYERRWTVWDLVSPAAPAGTTTAGVKLIAVSVIWHDPPFGRPREVVLYTQVASPGAIISALANSR